MITTTRMRLIPATATLLRAEVEQAGSLAALLDAEVPDNWPPEMVRGALRWFLQQLERTPDLCGWLSWYGVHGGGAGQRPILVGSGGFLGFPRLGMLEVGYSVLPQFQRRGLATEMVKGLLDWAFHQPVVSGVFADIHQENVASLRLAQSLHFVHTGPGKEPGLDRFILMAAEWQRI